MDITTGNFYFVSDDFFDKVNDPNLKRNYEKTQRPHYFALRDKEASLLWLIPCSSKIEKFERIIEKREKYNKQNSTIKIVTVQGKKTVLLLQDMFPITENYITNQYFRGGQPFRISNPEIVKDIERSARRVIILLEKGYKFTPTQPDVNRIKNLMLSEWNEEIEIVEDMNETDDFDLHM